MLLPHQHPRIYITEPEEIPASGLALLQPDYELIQGDSACTKNLIPHIQGLLIRSQTKVSREILNKFPELEFIIRIGVGVDTIDMAETQHRRISVYNAPGSNAHSVAEYVIGMMLYGIRKWNLLTPQDLTTWNRFKFMGSELRGKTIGIIGFGHFGRLIYQKLVPWQTNFIAYDPYLNVADLHYFSLHFAADLDEVLQTADIITLHLPLTPETHHLMNQDRLNLIQPHSLLMNASRGGIVDETAVINWVNQTESVYCADVFENEPLINPELINNPRIILTPHIAAMTEEANTAMAHDAIENFLNARLQQSLGNSHEASQSRLYHS